MDCERCTRRTEDFGMGAMIGALLLGIVWLSIDQVVAAFAGL